MLTSTNSQGKTVKAITLALILSTIAPFSITSPASAQLFRSSPYSTVPTNNPSYQTSQNPSNYTTVTIPAGTIIPVRFDSAEKILVTREETLPLTLIVAGNIRDRSGNVLIPYGSEIIGQIEPEGEGSRFVAQSLRINQGGEIPMSATSKIVTTTEVVDAGTNTDAIWQGALAGAAAATILAGVTGDTAIATEEVLGGTALGALAGWLLGGQYSEELIVIYPNQDLNLTLQSSLVIR
jgi:hypothetical protein